jgi:hypothetical protein
MLSIAVPKSGLNRSSTINLEIDTRYELALITSQKQRRIRHVSNLT